MSLKDIYEEYSNESGALSNLARQLGFAAGAIIWLFRGKESLILSGALLYSMIFLILYFFFDLLQSICAVLKLDGTIKKCLKEPKPPYGTKPQDIPCEKNKNDLIWTESALKIKIFFLIVSYVILICFYVHKL